MAYITLYKKGDSHEIRGVKCTAKRFQVKHLQAALKAGYFADPEQIKVKRGPKGEDPTPNPEPPKEAIVTGTPDATES